MKNKYKLVLLFAIIISNFSCLTVDRTIEFLRPAAIDIPKEIKTVAVISKNHEFKQEIYDLLINIFSQDSVKMRFTLIDQDNINMIMKQQNLYSSDDFDEETIVRIGKLSGAQSLVVGYVQSPSITEEKSSIVITRKYKNGDDVDFVDENQNSTLITFSYSIQIRMYDITTGKIIHAEGYDFKKVYESYRDSRPDIFISAKKKKNVIYSDVIPNITDLIREDGKLFGNEFAKKIAPYYDLRDVSFEIISGDKINEVFIKYIDQSMVEEAADIIKSNIDKIDLLKKDEIKSKHYYNLGLTYEAMGNPYNAAHYFNLSIKLDPSERHLEAFQLNKERILELEQLKHQVEL